MSLKRGGLIKVRAFGGKEIVRRFIAKRNGTVLICSEEEYESARLAKRQPMCVGFPASDVVEFETNTISSLEGSQRKTNKSRAVTAKRKVKRAFRRRAVEGNKHGAI